MDQNFIFLYKLLSNMTLTGYELTCNVLHKSYNISADWYIYICLMLSYVWLFQAVKPVKFGTVAKNMESPTSDRSSCAIPRELRALEDKESTENNCSRSLGIIKYTREQLMTYNTSSSHNNIEVKKKVAKEMRKIRGKRENEHPLPHPPSPQK